MVEFVLMLAMVGVLWLIVCVFMEVLGVMATHMRGNPEAAKAIIEHVFLPLFGGKKEPERKSPPGTAMVVRNASAEAPASNN